MNYSVVVTKPAFEATGQKSGKKYMQQTCQIQLIGKDGQPEELRRLVQFFPPTQPSGEIGYAPGEYELAPWALTSGEYDGLEVRLVLIPKGTGAKPQPSPTK